MKKRRITKSRVLLAAFIVVAFIGQAVVGDTIRLRSAVRLSPNDLIANLGDIAELSGPLAEQMADLVIMTLQKPGDSMEISIRSVRAALDKAGAHWGRIQLSGRKVVVHPGPVSSTQPLIAMNGASLIESGRVTRKPGRNGSITAQALMTLNTVRSEVAQFFAREMRKDPENLKLMFLNSDGEFLDIAHQRYRIEIEPLPNLYSDRVNLKVRLWEGGRIVQRQSISVEVLLRTTFAQATHDISRHDVLRESDLQSTEQWLPPSEASLTADMASALGHVSSRHIKTGQTVLRNTITRQTIVRRGDPIIVRCLVGGAVISLQAEARGDGSEGDLVECRKKGERDTFFATITAPGEAIINLSRP